MRMSYVVPCLFTMVSFAGLAAAASTHDQFIRGRTTVAMAEQGLGAPMDTVMAPDGALTLVYPTARFAERMPSSLPLSAAHARVVGLQFSPSFTYQGAVVRSAEIASR